MSRRFPLGPLTLLLSLPAMAGPARPDLTAIEQPDGTRIPVRIRGDEFQGWTETLEGYTVLRNEASGLWEYAQREAVSGALRPSGHAVIPGTPAPSFLSGGLRPKRDTLRERATVTQRKAVFEGRTASALSGLPPALAVTGNKKLLVILVGFADRALVTTPATWSSVLFQTGTGVKSVRQFYRDNSSGVVDIQPVSHTQSGTSGVVSVTIAANHPNYGGDITYSAETAWLNLALAQAATYVDFAALDTNGDGEIAPSEAAIYFIPAGYETSGSSKTPSIWAHAWGGSVTAGTKVLNTWAMNGELNNADRQHPMGVIAHELGHSLIDLPDLYDTSYTNNGLGHWSLMSYGSWGADTGEDSGSTPVTLDAWCRQYLGWASPQTPGQLGQTVTLGLPLSSTQAVAKLQSPLLASQEYFLVENRHPSGWDRGLVANLGSGWAGGLLTLHVDETISSNAYVSGSHQMVMAEHANNAAYGSMGSASSLFYSGGNASFTPLTTPSSNLYSGSSSLVGFTAASSAGTSMSFSFYADTSTISISVTPTTAVLLPGASLVLTASGDQGWGVAWSLAGSSGGSKVDSGLTTTLTAPAGTPVVDLVFTVQAASALDASITDSSTVTVKSMDLDGSGGVDPQDLLSLSAQWGQGASAPANLKGTGTVDNTDLDALLGQL